KRHNPRDIKKVEEFLETAISMDDKSKYYYLSAIIKDDFYARNGLRNNGPGCEERISDAEEADYDFDEVEMLLEHVPIKNENLVNRIRKA
ncbi:MAG: hypothetical protein ACLFQK_11460, partial [Fibrobacterota bacterium]